MICKLFLECLRTELQEKGEYNVTLKTQWVDTDTEEIVDLMDLSLSDIKDNAEDYVVILKTEKEVRYNI